ncbi:MAG TPA: energy transducer TonB [Mucilaginibacter sp.]
MKKILIIFVVLFAINARAQTNTPDTNHRESIPEIGALKDSDTIVRISVERNAEFPGGTDRFFSFIRKNLTYPSESHDKGIQGDVIVSFTVSPDGSLTNIAIKQGLAPDLDAEALKVVRLSPKWTPAMQNNKKVAVKFTVPVTFKLN